MSKHYSLKSLFHRPGTPNRDRRANVEDNSGNTSTISTRAATGATSKAASQIPSEIVKQQTVQETPSVPSKVPQASSKGLAAIETSTAGPLLSEESQEDLWDEAYNKLKTEQAKLFRAYQNYIANPDGFGSKDRPAIDLDAIHGRDRERYLAVKIEAKLQDIKSKQWPAAAKAYGKIVKGVVFAKDFIATAASNEPHAALAWAGVSMLLPLLLNPAVQDEAAAQGLADISDLILQYRVIEKTYRDPASWLTENKDQDIGGLRSALREKIIALYYQVLEFQMRMAYHYGSSSLKRYFQALITSDDWQSMHSAITSKNESIRVDLSVISHARLEAGFSEQNSKFDKVLSTNKEYFDTLQSSISGLRADTTTQIQQLSSLACAEYAAFNSFKKNNPPPECLAGTRIDILSKIQDWGKGHGDECILWLNGMAGTGKSTIARTAARRFHENGCLGASFFFSRGQEDLGDASKLFPTLARQLADALPDLKRHVCDAITKDSTIGRKSLTDQWKRLILQPLLILEESLLLSVVLVVVIDALDECEGHGDISEILRLLIQVKDLKLIRMRVFITSRPETPIRLGFHNMPEIVHHDLMLHSIPRSVIEHDIALFLRYELGKVKKDRFIEIDWPGEENIQKLIHKADRLFIYAATICRFIGGCLYPEKRLSEMLQVSSASPSSTKELDRMYMQILEYSIATGCDEDKKDMAMLFKQIVGSIVILFDSLPSTALTKLLDVPLTEMKRTLEPLHSVLDVSQDEASPIQLFHLSFHDFLLDKTRCSDPQFWIDEMAAHNDVFMHCLKLMSEHLRKDICDLRFPGALTSEVQKNKVEKCLPLDVQYACRYWVSHLQRSNVELHDVGHVYEFLKAHFLHWLEALSLIKKMSEGVHMVTELSKYLSTLPPGKNTELYDMVHDARRFVLNYRSVIEMAPLQVYSSALVFSPMRSTVKSLFSNQAPAWIKSMPVVQEDWSSLLQTLEGHSDCVTAVAFSPPDGKLVASASDDKTVRLWDSATGVARGTLEGHSDGVTAVAFSPPDGKLVASASYDNTVRLWDSATGAAIGTLEGHSGGVMAVAFSPPDGKLVASASFDKTVRLWDSATGAARGTLEGHSGRVMAVAFSPPDGKLVASASFDKTVRLWDSATGAARSTLEGHSIWVTAVAFSPPDGKLVASASYDKTVRLWDSATRAALGTLEGHSGRVMAVAFSPPDGKLVASASSDNTVRLWDSATGAALGTLEGHSKEVTAVAFSPPDGKLVASASYDKTVRLWDSATGAELYALEVDTVIGNLSFSSDGTYLKTNRGLLSIQPLFPSVISPQSKPLCNLLVNDRWVAQEMKNILWLPSDYRATCAAVQDNVLILGHASDRISFLEFDPAYLPYSAESSNS